MNRGVQGCNEPEAVVLSGLCLSKFLKLSLVLVSDAGVPGLLGVVFLHRAGSQLTPGFASDLSLIRDEVLFLELQCLLVQHLISLLDYFLGRLFDD